MMVGIDYDRIILIVLEEEMQRGVKTTKSSVGVALSQDEKDIMERIYKLDNIKLNQLYEEKLEAREEERRKKEDNQVEVDIRNEEEERENVKTEENAEDEEETKKKMDEEQARLNELMEEKSESVTSTPVQEIGQKQQVVQFSLNEKFFISGSITTMPSSSIFNTLYTTSIKAPTPFTADEVTYEDLPIVPYPHVKDHVMTLSPAEKESLALQRNLTQPSPYNLTQLRVDYGQGLRPSYLFDNRPRSDFYTVSQANETEKMPLLMDTFSYCVDDDLYLEAIFSLKYMYNACGRQATRVALKDTWYAVYKHKRALNRIKWDTHKHSVVTSFLFPHYCTNENHDFYVYSETTQFNYTFTAVHIPDFTTRKYFLSACTAIDQSHPMQVKAWLNYNYFHGIEHVTIYVNAKPEFWHRHLDYYVRHGYLDLVEYTYPNHRTLYEQPSILNACNRRYLYASRYVIYNDVDEYFLPMNVTWRIVDVVHFYDNQFPNVAAFRVGYEGWSTHV